MPYIPLSDRPLDADGLFAFPSPLTGPLRCFIHDIMRGPAALNLGERELVAAYVSRRNDCAVCWRIHKQAAADLLGLPIGELDYALADPGTAPINDRLKALLRLAERVQIGGRAVTDEVISELLAQGLTHGDIHDTIVVAAAASMMNRFVDGLGAGNPEAWVSLETLGTRVAADGYLGPA